VLAAMRDGILKAAGTGYPLGDAAKAHADLEAGRSIGALYLVP
jgi:NADPH:quinone reductase